MGRLIENCGESMEEAVLILDAQDLEEIFLFEYRFLRKKFGRVGIDFKILQKSLIFDFQQTPYHWFQLVLNSGGKEKQIYFNIGSGKSRNLVSGHPGKAFNRQMHDFSLIYQALGRRGAPLSFFESELIRELCKDTELS